MGRKKNKKSTKIIQFGQDDVDNNIKYVLPIDKFDMHFLQLNYNKLKVRNNDNAVPVWNVQQNNDNNYYEFEIVGESDDTSHSGISSAVVKKSNKLSTEEDSAMKNTVTQLNTVNAKIDFTTYMKIVNVFNESDISVTGSATEQASSVKGNNVKDKTSETKTVANNTAAKLEVVKNNEHQVTLRVSSGEEVKVSMNNFHGFWRSGDSVQCRVCMIMVNDVEAHKMEIRHMKKIAPVLKDVHCIRKIGPIFNHCVLCNEIIENIEFHLKSNEAHSKYLEETLEVCESTTITQNNTYINSDLLSIPGVAGSSTSQSTINSYRTVLDKSLILNVKSPIVLNIKEEDTSIKPDEVKNISITNESKDFVSCDVCDRKMHVNTLKSHIEGKYHKAELLSKSKHKEYTEVAKKCELPSVGGVKYITGNQYPVKENLAFNKPANENFKTHNDKLRAESGANREQLAFDTGRRVSASDESKKNMVYCTVCDRTMHINTLKSHEEGKYHKKMQMLDKAIKHEDISAIKTEKLDLKCELRPSSPPKSFEDKVQKNLQRQIGYQDGDRYHTNENEQQFYDKIKMQCTDTNSTVNISTKSIRNTADIEKIKYLMKEVENTSFVECRMCHVTVPNTYKNALEHIFGTKHYNEYMFLLNHNKIARSGNLSYCEACKVPVDVATELIHIETEYHKSTITATKVKDENDGRTATSLTNDVAKTEMPEPRTNANIQIKMTYPRDVRVIDKNIKNKQDFENVNSEIKCELRPTSTQETFYDEFQKNLTRRILGNCNGDRYDEILFNASLDTFAKKYVRNRAGTSTKRDLTKEMVGSLDKDVLKTKVADPSIQSPSKNVVADPRAQNDARNKITDTRALNMVVKNNSSIRHGKETECNDANDYGNINSKMTINVTNVQHKYTYNVQNNSLYATEKTNEQYSSVKPSSSTIKRAIAFCSKCEEMIYFNHGNVKHVRGCCMTAIFYTHLISIEIDHSVNNIFVYCRHCLNDYDSGYLRNATELYKHIITPGHINRLNKTSAINSNHKICDLMNRYQYNTLRCQVCHEIVDNLVYHVMTHLMSDDHKSKFEKFLLDNKITDYGGYFTRTYWCRLCQARIENQEEIYTHINTDNHKRMLDKTKKMTFMQKALISSGFFLICLITYYTSKYIQSQRVVPKPPENTLFEYFWLDFT